MEQTETKAPQARENERFFELIRTFSNAMLVTLTPEGMPHARPMNVADVSSRGDFWFVTRETSPKMEELSKDHHALVVAQEKGRYLTLRGTVEVHRDRQRIHDLWSEAWRVWFKDPDDPEIVLLRLRGEEGEYWDYGFTEGLKYLAKAAAAYVRRRPLEDRELEPEQHGRVTL